MIVSAPTPSIPNLVSDLDEFFGSAGKNCTRFDSLRFPKESQFCNVYQMKSKGLRCRVLGCEWTVPHKWELVSETDFRSTADHEQAHSMGENLIAHDQDFEIACKQDHCHVITKRESDLKRH